MTSMKMMMMMMMKKENEYLGVVGRKMLRTARFSSGSLQWVGSSLSFIALKLKTVFVKSVKFKIKVFQIKWLVSPVGWL